MCVCSRRAWVLITGTDGSCLKPSVSCNDSRVSVIISPTEPSLHSLITSSHSPTDSLHIHCHSLKPLTSQWNSINHLNCIQILSLGMIAFFRMDSDSISLILAPYRCKWKTWISSKSYTLACHYFSWYNCPKKSVFWTALFTGIYILEFASVLKISAKTTPVFTKIRFNE